jgi:hypothetical protein
MLDTHFALIPERVPVKAAYDKATRYRDYRRCSTRRRTSTRS